LPHPAAPASAGSRRGHRVFGRLGTPSRYGFADAAPQPSGEGAAGHAEVWSARVDSATASSVPRDWLDDTERTRAAGFRFERDRRRFVDRRAFLRRVLAGYLGVEPNAIRYRRGPGGRPELDPRRGISFTTSHADGLAVVAVSLDRIVGIDIEHVRAIPGAADIARSLFTRREHEHLESLGADGQSTAFLRLWTRKEAYAKAVGAGLALPLDSFDVLDDVVQQRVGGPADGAHFSIVTLDLSPGYVGSIAVSAA
jgi:4'-phosphopantetheinyl transferase